MQLLIVNSRSFFVFYSLVFYSLIPTLVRGFLMMKMNYDEDNDDNEDDDDDDDKNLIGDQIQDILV